MPGTIPGHSLKRHAPDEGHPRGHATTTKRQKLETQAPMDGPSGLSDPMTTTIPTRSSSVRVTWKSPHVNAADDAYMADDEFSESSDESSETPRAVVIARDGDLLLEVGKPDDDDHTFFQVDSSILRGMSLFFAGLLSGPLARAQAEHARSHSELWTASLPDDSPDAMRILLLIAHDQPEFNENKLPLVLLDLIVCHAKRYALFGLLKTWAHAWLLAAETSVTGTDDADGLPFGGLAHLCSAAYHLGNESMVRRCVWRLCLETSIDEENGFGVTVEAADGERFDALCDVAHVVPLGILSIVVDVRQALLQQAIDSVYRVIDERLDSSRVPRCVSGDLRIKNKPAARRCDAHIARQLGEAIMQSGVDVDDGEDPRDAGYVTLSVKQFVERVGVGVRGVRALSSSHRLCYTLAGLGMFAEGFNELRLICLAMFELMRTKFMFPTAVRDYMAGQRKVTGVVNE